MAKLVALITITTDGERSVVDKEVRATSLEQLYEACRQAPPSKLVRIAIHGAEGEVRLNFASFIQKQDA